MARARRGGGDWLAPVWTLAVIVACFSMDACGGQRVRIEPFGLPGMPTTPKVRVGLSRWTGVARVTVRAEGGLLAQGAGMRQEYPAAEEIRVVREGTAIRVGARAFEAGEVRLADAGGGPIEVEGRVYRGAILVYRAGEGLALVNEVDLEDYLAAVVGCEMSPSWPQEALRAQAVAARSYAWASIRAGLLRAAGQPFDLYDDERSQVYRGAEAEDARVREAVEATRGIVLVSDGAPLMAYYHSACGGRTDPAWMVLRGAPRAAGLDGSECGFCAESPRYRWTVRIPVRELEEAWAVRGLQAIEVVDRTPSGRARRLRLRCASGETILDATGEFRARLGGRRILSTWWERVAIEDGTVEIAGRGWGHGAGMCQWGACGMARRGADAWAILERYYPGAALKKWY